MIPPVLEQYSANHPKIVTAIFFFEAAIKASPEKRATTIGTAKRSQGYHDLKYVLFKERVDQEEKLLFVEELR